MGLNKFKRGDLVRFMPSIRRIRKGDNRALGWTASDENDNSRFFANVAVTGNPDRTMIVLDNNAIVSKITMIKVLCNRTAKVFVTYDAWLEAVV